MGITGDRLAAMDIECASPDGNIRARLTSGDTVEVWFVGDSYHHYHELALAQQLTALGRLVVVARRRVRLAALSAALGRPVQPDGRRPETPRERRFRDEQAKIRAVGRAGEIEISGGPTSSWSVKVTPGALRRLTEAQFLGQLHTAISSTVVDLRRQIIHTQESVYGEGLPSRPAADGSRGSPRSA